MPDYELELGAWGRAANAEVADLTAQRDAALADDSADDSRIAELEAALAAKDVELAEQAANYQAIIAARDATIAQKNATLANKNATIARLRAERDALKAELEECQGGGDPDPEPSRFPAALGYCPDDNTPATVARLGQWSGAKVRRSYKSPGSFPSTPTFAGDAAAGLRTAHTMKGPGSSMKDRMERALTNLDRAQWKAYIAKSAKDSVLGAEHEPEDDNPGGDLYRRFQRWFSQLVREVNAEDGGNRLVAGNLMSWTNATEMQTYYPGDGFWDILGFDGYNWPNRTPGSTSVPKWVEFEEIFRPDHDTVRSMGLDFAIFEYGCRKADLYHQCNNENLPTEEFAQKQIDWHKKAWPVIQELDPVVCTYFHHDWWLMPEAGHRAMGGQYNS